MSPTQSRTRRLASTRASRTEEDGLLLGTLRPPRYGASIIDHLTAFFMMVAMGGSSADFLARHQIPGTESLIGASFFLLYYLYFLMFEWLLGATPGKLIMGLTVRSLDGSRCTFRQAFLRTSTRILETNPILLGKLPAAIIALKSKRHQRWGDQLAGTVVVEASRIT